MTAAKRDMMYLSGTNLFRLCISGSSSELVAWANADWAGDSTDRKSTTGILPQLGSSSVLWRPAKQPCVSLSSTEAEHIAMSECAKNIVWARSVLHDLQMTPTSPTVLYEDHQGAIGWSTDGVRRSKHISVRTNYVRVATQ